jgi:hypothetical protein
MLRFKKKFGKKAAKKMAFLAQNKAKVCKILIIMLVFEKNAIFSPKIVENRRKLLSYHRPQVDKFVRFFAPKVGFNFRQFFESVTNSQKF